LVALERSAGADASVSIVPAYDFVPGTYGARVTVWQNGRTYRTDFYGAPTAERLLGHLERWCAQDLGPWLLKEKEHDSDRIARGCKAGVATADAVAQAAAPLYVAAGAVSGHCDNSIGDNPVPKSVARWLQQRGYAPLPRQIISDLYAAHLDGSRTWAHLIRSDWVPRQEIK
jgi:hypothetical protein